MPNEMIAPASIMEIEHPLPKVLRIPYRKHNEAKRGALTFLCDGCRGAAGAPHNLRRIDWFAVTTARHIVMA